MPDNQATQALRRGLSTNAETDSTDAASTDLLPIPDRECLCRWAMSEGPHARWLLTTGDDDMRDAYFRGLHHALDAHATVDPNSAIERIGDGVLAPQSFDSNATRVDIEAIARRLVSMGHARSVANRMEACPSCSPMVTDAVPQTPPESRAGWWRLGTQAAAWFDRSDG